MFNFINSALIGMEGLPSPKPALPAAANGPITTFLNWAMRSEEHTSELQSHA